MSAFDVLPQEIRHIQSAYRRRDYASITNAQVIQAALYFDGIFRSAADGAVRSQVAAILVALYYELNRRMRSQPLDRALPFPGAGGSAAEIVDDIVPFMSLDIWRGSLETSHPARHAARRQRSRTQTIDMDGETVSGSRPSSDVPQMRDMGQMGRITPLPDTPGPIGDIAGILDTGNGVLGVIAMALESFALDVFGTLAGGVISVFGLAATWIDSDRQIARIHAAHQTIETIYDMSGPFRDRELFRRPYAQWPALRTPVEPTLSPGNSHEAQIHNAARTAARQRAYQSVLDRESHPTTQIVQYNGREYRIPVTGKVYLYYLNLEARRRGVGVNIYLRDVMQRRTGVNLGMFRWD